MVKKRQLRSKEIKDQMAKQLAEQSERRMRVEERKRKEFEKRELDKQVMREEDKLRLRKSFEHARVRCQQQIVPYTEEDCKSAKIKLENFAALMTDDDFVAMRKKLVGCPKGFDQHEFQNFFASPTVPLDLSPAEISSLGLWINTS
jgi:hypothetical protein